MIDYSSKKSNKITVYDTVLKYKVYISVPSSAKFEMENFHLLHWNGYNWDEKTYSNELSCKDNFCAPVIVMDLYS